MFKIAKFVLIEAGLLAVLTVFLFPTTRAAIVKDADSLRPLDVIDYVTLSPAFMGLEYSFNMAPNLGKYEHAAPSGKIYVAKQSPDAAGFFEIYYATADTGGRGFDPTASFAWRYWLLIDLLPTLVIGCVVAWRFWGAYSES